jgi:hypothetical protein
MKIKVIGSMLILSALFNTFPAICQTDNSLSKKEKKEGWELLFNGKNFDGWRLCNSSEMAKNWVIEDNAMKVFTDAGLKPSGDILFGSKKFKNFELSIEWKASKGANSGIFYNITEIPGKPIYAAAPEMQILDNEFASDNQAASHLAGSLYDMLPCDPKTVNPYDHWNHTVISVKDGNVIHFMNGEKVVEYTLWTPEWNKLVANSKFRDWPGFTQGIAKEGYIGLQDHGNIVYFKNIKIREIK